MIVSTAIGNLTLKRTIFSAPSSFLYIKNIKIELKYRTFQLKDRPQKIKVARVLDKN